VKLKREERIQVGKKIYEKQISIADAMKQYNASRSCIEGWQTLYKRSAGIVPGWMEDKNSSHYDDLSKDELLEDLMKKDIEIERLKKVTQ